MVIKLHRPYVLGGYLEDSALASDLTYPAGTYLTVHTEGSPSSGSIIIGDVDQEFISINSAKQNMMASLLYHIPDLLSQGVCPTVFAGLKRSRSRGRACIQVNQQNQAPPVGWIPH